MLVDTGNVDESRMNASSAWRSASTRLTISACSSAPPAMSTTMGCLGRAPRLRPLPWPRPRNHQHERPELRRLWSQRSDRVSAFHRILLLHRVLLLDRIDLLDGVLLLDRVLM